MFKSLMQPLQLLIKGVSGKDRQAKQQLSQQLFALQGACGRLQKECDRLQQDNEAQRNAFEVLQRDRNELDTLLSYADRENQDLSTHNKQLRSQLQQLEENNQLLRSKLIYLNQKADIRAYQQSDGQSDGQSGESLRAKDGQDPISFKILPTEKSRQKAARQKAGEFESTSRNADTHPLINLSQISLALIGGHETTYREVSEALKAYGLKRCIHVPPHSIASNSRNQIKDKISQCDLIVTITTYVDHSVVRCVKQLKEAQLLAGDVIRVSCHGKSGVVREVIAYFSTEQPA